MEYYDAAVIGGGPGGYTAAAHAAQAGLRVVLFEKDKLGGTCLNRGCIPTKSLLHSAQLYETARGAADAGVCASGLSYDMAAMHAKKTQVVDTLRAGVEKMLKTNKVAIVNGAAQVTGQGLISCDGTDYSADHIIIAAGSVPSVPPIPGAELPGVYVSNDLLEGEAPDFDRLIIIGGGVIGVETASIYLSLGKQISILEAEKQILPNMDKDLAQRLSMVLKKKGAAVETSSRVTGISGTPGNMTVSCLDKKGKEKTFTADGVLIATGRRANTAGLFAPGAAPEMERGAIAADAAGRTNIPGLYVIGDARARNIQLAHLAEAQGKNTAAIIAGKEPYINEALVPSCIYTDPEIASVGLTEAEAKAAGYSVKCAKTLTGGNGKCVIEGAASGYVKLVCDAASSRLLGAQLICPRATDLVGELSLAIAKGLTADDLKGVIHPHPTFSEMIPAAASLV